jgi:hypothetical protein
MTMDPNVDHELDLPALGDDDDRDGVDGEALSDLAAQEDDAESLDDSVAADLPLEVEIQTASEEPTVVGDDAEGLDRDGDEAATLAEEAESMLDDAAEGMDDAEADLGLPGDDARSGGDDGGAEGVDDPVGEHVDELPPLDGDERDEDEDELDVGVEMESPPALDDDGD